MLLQTKGSAENKIIAEYRKSYSDYQKSAIGWPKVSKNNFDFIEETDSRGCLLQIAQSVVGKLGSGELNGLNDDAERSTATVTDAGASVLAGLQLQG